MVLIHFQRLVKVRFLEVTPPVGCLLGNVFFLLSLEQDPIAHHRKLEPESVSVVVTSSC